MIVIVSLIVFMQTYTIEAKDHSVGEYELELKCATTDNKIKFSNEKFSIYEVDKFNAYEKKKYTKNKEKYTAKLLSDIQKNKTKAYTKIKSDSNGVCKVALKNGVYLISGEEVRVKKGTGTGSNKISITKYVKYTPEPMLISINNKKVTCYVKYTSDGGDISNKDPYNIINKLITAAKTGDDLPILEYLAIGILGILTLVFGILGHKRSKRTDEVN